MPGTRAEGVGPTVAARRVGSARGVSVAPLGCVAGGAMGVGSTTRGTGVPAGVAGSGSGVGNRSADGVGVAESARVGVPVGEPGAPAVAVPVTVAAGVDVGLTVGRVVAGASVGTTTTLVAVGATGGAPLAPRGAVRTTPAPSP